MKLSARFQIRLKPAQDLTTVIVGAKKNPGSGDRFPKRHKRPRKKYSPDYIDRGDISALHDKDTIPVENIAGLVVDCAERIKEYIKADNLSAAEELFCLMAQRNVTPNVVTYNTMMSGYSKTGNYKRVFALFDEMVCRQIELSTVTFAIAIRACAQTEDVEKALNLFEDMKREYELTPDKFVYSALLKVCASAKDLSTAKNTFEEVSLFGVDIDNVVMNTMIDVYAECSNKNNGKNYLKKCRKIMEEMDRKAVRADVQTYSTLLKLCARSNLTKDAIILLNEEKNVGLYPNEFSYATVIDGISKDMNLSNEEVLAMSSEITRTMKSDGIKGNNHTYNSLLSVAIRLHDLNKAIHLFNEMKNLKIRPNSVTYGAMVKCYERLGDPSNRDAYLKPCLGLLKECERNRTKFNVEGYTSLLSACAKASNVDEASRIWDKILRAGVKLDTYLYSAMINACVCGGDKNKAAEVFNDMKTRGLDPDAFAYGAMIKCYEKLGDSSDKNAYLKTCLDVWKECEHSGSRIDAEGYTSLLSACANVSNLDEAERIWKKMLEKRITPNAYLYNAMINCCLSKDQKDRAFGFLKEMKTAKIMPNRVTYTTFLSYFIKKKKVSEAKRIYDEMQKLGIKLENIHSKTAERLRTE
eukprot:g282.t1